MITPLSKTYSFQPQNCCKRIARKQLYKTERKKLVYCCVFCFLCFSLLFFQWEMENMCEEMRHEKIRVERRWEWGGAQG